ncbi:SURF1 family protein [Alcaligenaceae bacterium CGII-47]|nr:SURF1 family protein [Alcaligenaceae bacterium CGII-47]
MADPQRPIRQLATLIILGVLVIICASAGSWQLRRAAQRTALMHAIEAGRQAPPIKLSAQITDGPDWHTAQVRGTWLDRFTVHLDNRNLNGHPGLWIATPLQLHDDPTRAVLVLRGWVARPLGTAQLPDLRLPDGPVTIQGTLLHHVPRIFELGSLTGNQAGTLPARLPLPDGAPPRVQNLPLAELASATGLSLLPIILEQAPVPNSPLIQEWPGPSLNADQNYGYALQWFSFATIALIAALVTVWRTWLLPRRRTTPSPMHKDSQS